MIYYNIIVGLIIYAIGIFISGFLFKRYKPTVIEDERTEKIRGKAMSLAYSIYGWSILIAVTILFILGLLNLAIIEQVQLIVLTLFIGFLILSALFAFFYHYYQKKI